MLLDPIGFAFEHYDGIGRYRTTDNEQPVDASGTLQLGSGTPVKFKDAVELMPALAAADEVRSCMATQWTRYLLRREETKGDMPSLEAVQKAFRDSSYDMRELLVAIVSSDAFTQKDPRRRGGAAMNAWEIRRRDVLKALGVGMGCLPLLQSSRGIGRRAAPKRLLIVAATEGYRQQFWRPMDGSLDDPDPAGLLQPARAAQGGRDLPAGHDPPHASPAGRTALSRTTCRPRTAA